MQRRLSFILPLLALGLAVAGLFLPALPVEVRGAGERFGPWAIVSDGDLLSFFNQGDLVRSFGANPLASSGGDIEDFTLTLAIQNGSDAFALWDVNLTNANHTGSSNTVRVLDIAGVTADAQSQENAIEIAAGWDVDLDGATSLEVGVDNTVVLTAKDPATADSAATTNGLNVAYAAPVDTTGTNTHNALNIAAVSANATGGTNTINGIDIDAITGDAQITENAINVGTGYDVGLNIAGGGAVIVGTFTVDASEIGAAEISNPTRSINLSIDEFYECSTDAGTAIGYDTTADALPDYANSSTDGLNRVLRFDAVSGTPDNTYICASFQVPQDYASGGTFRVSLLRAGDTGATEILNVNVNEAGAALATVDSDTLAGTAEQEINSAPTTMSYAVGDSFGVTIYITSGTTVDEAVDIYSVSFEYVATQ